MSQEAVDSKRRSQEAGETAFQVAQEVGLRGGIRYQVDHGALRRKMWLKFLCWLGSVLVLLLV